MKLKSAAFGRLGRRALSPPALHVPRGSEGGLTANLTIRESAVFNQKICPQFWIPAIRKAACKAQLSLVYVQWES